MESAIKVSKSSRLVTTTLLGVVFGIICMLLSRYTAQVAFWLVFVVVIIWGLLIETLATKAFKQPQYRKPALLPAR